MICFLLLLFLATSSSISASCPFDCSKDGCCYARENDIVCKSYKESNVFNISTIIYTEPNLDAAALTYCATYLCFLSADDDNNACVKTTKKINKDEETTSRIALPSGATGLLRQGHTHLIDYPRVLFIFRHLSNIIDPLQTDYNLVKLHEDISFTSTINNYRIYEEKLCKFVNFEIRCTDGNVVDAHDACPEIFQEGDTSIAYFLLVFSLCFCSCTICFACRVNRAMKSYEVLDKHTQAVAKEIRLEVEFSDIDLNTTAEESEKDDTDK